MTRVLGFVAGVVVGQWLAFGSLSPSAADPQARAARALERQDHAGALWSGGPAVPPAALAGRARPLLAGLDIDGAVGAGDAVAVPLEPALGVWVAAVSVDGGGPARFLVDTGSSVVIVAPRVAAAAGIVASPRAPRIELQTVAGRSSGPTVRVGSLRVGDLELLDVPIVLHDPGPGFDGILGNAFLSRYRLTLDPDRHLLVLRPLDASGPRDGPPPPIKRAPPGLRAE